MRIIGPGAANAAGSTKRKSSTRKADGSFGDLLGGDDDASVSASVAPRAVAPVSALSGILAAQVISDETPKKQAIAHGHDLLATLEELRHQLLMGEVTAQTANDMIQKIRQRQGEIFDPKLKGIIDDIELRVHVELAKLGR